VSAESQEAYPPRVPQSFPVILATLLLLLAEIVAFDLVLATRLKLAKFLAKSVWPVLEKKESADISI